MDYKIHISGLAQGKYEYEFPVKGDLFREYENQQVIDADVTARVTLEKGSGWMNAHLRGEGKVTVQCDRCLEGKLPGTDKEVVGHQCRYGHLHVGTVNIFAQYGSHREPLSRTPP